MLEKNKVNLIVIDLDDTVWTWFNMWYKSFKNLFENIKSTTNIEETILLESFRNLHKKYHSSEASFIIDELDCLNHDQICLLKDENHYVEGEFSLLHKYNHLKKNIHLNYVQV